MSSSRSSISSGNPTPSSAVHTATPPPTPINSIGLPNHPPVPFGLGNASQHHGHIQVLPLLNPYYHILINYPQLYPQYNFQFHQQNSHHQPIRHSQGPQPASKERVVFTDEQLTMLEEQFKKEKYIGGSDLKELSKTTGLSEKQVKAWFQNKRVRMRKNIQEDQCSSDSQNLQEVSRYRVKITNAQLAILEERFEKDKHIKKWDRVELGQAIGLSESSIKNWFQNKNQKLKKRIHKEHHEETDEEIDVCNF